MSEFINYERLPSREEVNETAYDEPLDVENNAFIVCQPCLAGDCEGCADRGIKSYPYWCACAIARHDMEAWQRLE